MAYVKKTNPNAITEEQGKILIDAWNSAPADAPPSVPDLMRLIYPALEKYDPRLAEGRAVKEWLASRSLTPQTKKAVKLTEEQEEFIQNNTDNMTVKDLVRALFKKSNATPLDEEYISIKKFIESNGKYSIDTDGKPILNSDFVPPKTVASVQRLIRKYIPDFLKHGDPTDKEKKCLTKCISYLQSFNFLSKLNGYTSGLDKEMFLSTFVRYVWGKDDLSEEDVDIIVAIAADTVQERQITQLIDALNSKIKESLDADDTRVSMSFVQSLKDAREDMDKCKKRQHQAMSMISTKRADRVKVQGANTESLVHLVEFFKFEQNRAKLLALAKLKNEKLKNEVDRLASMDSIKAEIWGLDKRAIIEQ